MKNLLIGLLAIGSLSAFATERRMDIKCSKVIMDVNGVPKDVRVSLRTDYEESSARVKLSITTKPANSPSRRSNPIPNDAISVYESVSFTSVNNREHTFITDNRNNGYIINAKGELYGSNSDSSSTFVKLSLKAIGSPTLKIEGDFSCSASYDW